LGALGKEVSGSRLDASGLRGLLSSQSGFLKNALPAGLAGIIGLPGISSAASQVMRPTEKTKESYLKWLLLLLALAAALVYFLSRGCAAPQVKAPVAPVEKGAGTVTTETPKGYEKLGTFMATKLPNGIELNLPEFGVEKKLIAFIEDPNKPVDKTTWFSFDRLEFETGSAVLKPSSQEQLKNLAEILKAYPKVTLKLGGYTDNTGDPQSNLQLSKQRAETTMQELVKLGVDAKRLEAEGYGEQNPIADNATEEGKQMNRRIDLRVTSK
jgi:outer membrane protein OmpA-like peptidoglycan-associated protein